MIASTTFTIIFLLAIIFIADKTTATDSATAKNKTMPKSLQDSTLVENQNSAPKITISVYYGSLCADCRNLFANQIAQNLEKFKKYVNFDFVPYGNVEKKVFYGRLFFKCQNGLDECMKNKWQACSIHVLPSKMQSLLANYLVCFMNSTNEIHSGYQCTRKLGLYDGFYSKIKKCYMDKELSEELTLQYGNRTQYILSNSTQRIPAVIFNGVYNENEQKDVKNDLAGVICKYLHPKPAGIC